jgi:hypothetical protein
MGSSSSSSSTPQQQQQQYNSHYGYGGGGSRLSTPGSAVLATLLTHYSKKAAKPFAASVAALSAADAARAAKDPAGSRVLQVRFRSGYNVVLFCAGSFADGMYCVCRSGCLSVLQLLGSRAVAWKY